MRQQEECALNRRQLLTAGAALAAYAVLPAPGHANSLGRSNASGSARGERPVIRWDRRLVVIELNGGNDGLNTIIPHSDSTYRSLRSRLAVPADQIITWHDRFGFHPSLQPLMPAFQATDLAWVQGCGYKKPNRSHFRGIDIWHGGTDASTLAQDGWLARLLDEARQSAPPEVWADAIVWGNADAVGHSHLGPLFGRPLTTLVMESPKDYLRRANQLQALPDQTLGQTQDQTPGQATGQPTNNALQYVLRTRQKIGQTRQALATIAKTAEPSGFPSGGFGRAMQQTARCIQAGAPVPVYKCSLGGFDTHAGQYGKHANLLGQLAGGIAALRTTLMRSGDWDRTLVMTYSEFGRRAKENDSYGTDHGAAAPHLLAGGLVKGGMFGKQPSLRDLDGGDLKYNVDYRQLYATVGKEWFEYRGDFLGRSRLPGLKLIQS